MLKQCMSGKTWNTVQVFRIRKFIEFNRCQNSTQMFIILENRICSPLESYHGSNWFIFCCTEQEGNSRDGVFMLRNLAGISPANTEAFQLLWQNLAKVEPGSTLLLDHCRTGLPALNKRARFFFPCRAWKPGRGRLKRVTEHSQIILLVLPASFDYMLFLHLVCRPVFLQPFKSTYVIGTKSQTG